jgi:hypothetical protein
MVFASSIEAVTRLLMPKDYKHDANEADAIAKLIAHIDHWDGDSRLKSVASGAVRRLLTMTTVRMLRSLKSDGVITQEQLSAWEDIRNAVMHGSLISPYSEEVIDAQLRALNKLFHTLTEELLRRSAG